MSWGKTHFINRIVNKSIDNALNSVVLGAYDNALVQGENKIRAYVLAVDAYVRHIHKTEGIVLNKQVAAKAAVEIVLDNRSKIRDIILE